MFVGFGTLTNMVTVLAGAGVGLLVGHRLSPHVRTTVTAALGLVTLLIAGRAAFAVGDPALVDAAGDSAPMLVVLGSLVLGGILGAAARIEDGVEALGGVLQRRLTRSASSAGQTGEGRDRFVEGFVISSLVFCIGPLTILGSIEEGLGHGADQLLLKSTLDGFAALAFAASFGVGVMASAVSIGVIQGSLTVLGAALGSFLPDAHLAALTATGGLILIGVAMRLLDLKTFAVADLLPALVVAPLLCQVAVAVR